MKCFDWLVVAGLLAAATPASATVLGPCELEITPAGKADCYLAFTNLTRAESAESIAADQADIDTRVAILKRGGLTPAQVALLNQHIKDLKEDMAAIGPAEDKQLSDVWDSLFPPPPAPEPGGWWLAPACDGQRPVANFGVGDTCTLTSGFIDPFTGLPTVGPAIHSVFYEVNLDPATPAFFFPLGSSSDAASNFGLLFTVAGFEPLVRVTAFDALNNRIVGANPSQVATGYVVAIEAVPEPSSGYLAGLGLVAAGAWRTRTRRTAARSIHARPHAGEMG